MICHAMSEAATQSLEEIVGGPDKIEAFVAREALRYDEPPAFFADLFQH